MALSTPPDQVVFNVSNHPTRISVIEALRGKAGYLTLTRLTIDSYEREEYLLFSGFDDAGGTLDQEKIQKFERQQRRRRQEIFKVEDEIMEKRDQLIDSLERRLAQRNETETLFTVSWAVV